jgi:DNA repair exonuclease SbcCD nuclease subunit
MVQKNKIRFMRIFMISDTHFGVHMNEFDKWQNMMESTFYNFVIPFLKKNVKKGDILIHLGDLFDNRTSIPIITLNKVEKILKEISNIIPIHIMVGNHDLFNKGTNEVNSVRLFSYMSDNIFVYEKTTTIDYNGIKLVLMPWVEKRADMISEIDKNFGDYLFCHSDLNGCKMHLTSVAHRNSDKIDVGEFKKYKRVFSGHVHIRQIESNFEFIGSLYQMDRNDFGDQKGITVLDLSTESTEFYPNTYSPVFKKIYIRTQEDIESLELVSTKDYIDLFISNSLLINNRKLRRKLEMMLESGNFASVDYIDDLVLESGEVKSVIDEITEDELNNGVVPSIQLEYTDLIRQYINSQKYESEKIKNGVLQEFNEIAKIYDEGYLE